MARGSSSLAVNHLLPDSTTEFFSTLLCSRHLPLPPNTAAPCSSTAGKSPFPLHLVFWEQLYVVFLSFDLITLYLHFFFPTLCPEVWPQIAQFHLWIPLNIGVMFQQAVYKHEIYWEKFSNKRCRVPWEEGNLGSQEAHSWIRLADGFHSHLNSLHVAEYPLFFSSFFIYFFIEVYLIYNVVLISAVQQSDSVIHIYTFFFILFFIMVYPSILSIVPCAIQ